MWVDMRATNVDVLISAPQKGWSSSPCCAMVMLGERARAAIDATSSSSFACDLKKWMQIAEGYEKGQHAYHATMPTDALVRLRDVMLEARGYGFEKLRAEQVELGAKVRKLLESRGFPSVAAEGWKAPGVVVSYTTDPDIQSGRKFIAAGLQTASGVPLQCGEGADFRTFRMGLFGLEKWHNVDRTVGHVAAALEKVAQPDLEKVSAEEAIMRKGLMTVMLVLAISAHAAEQPASKSSEDSAGKSVAEAARAVGHATRDVAREVGHATRDATKAVGHASREVAKDAGHAAAAGAKDAKASRHIRQSKDKKPGTKPAANPAGKQPCRLERVMGIEPTLVAWEATVLPLNYTRDRTRF